MAFTPDKPKSKFTADEPSALVDVAKQGGAGLVEGVAGLVGLPGTAGNLMRDASYWLARKAGIEPPEPYRMTGLTPDIGQVMGAVEGVTGELPEAETTAGGYARKIGQFAPGLAFGPGGLIRRGLAGVALPAVGAETASIASGGNPYAEAAGALAGAMTPAALARVITPLPISAERQAMVNALRKEGVKPTAGQVTGRRGLKYAESEIGGGAAANAIDAQQDQFTAAALKRVGENANRATPEVIDNAFKRIGSEFDGISSRNSLTPDKQMMSDAYNAAGNYYRLATNPVRAVKDYFERLQKMSASPSIRGDEYQALRSQIGEDLRSTSSNLNPNSDPLLKSALIGLQDAVDDAFERSMVAAGNHGDVAALNTARRQYRNLISIVDAATGPGESAAMGAISPAKLRGVAVRQGKRDYARGRGDFSELARAGEAIMTPMPQSGTAPRQWARAVTSALGAGIGGTYGGGAEAMMGAVAGSMAPAIAGRGLMSRPFQSYLANQLIKNGMSVKEATKRGALAEALMNLSSEASAQ